MKQAHSLGLHTPLMRIHRKMPSFGNLSWSLQIASTCAIPWLQQFTHPQEARDLNNDCEALQLHSVVRRFLGGHARTCASIEIISDDRGTSYLGYSLLRREQEDAFPGAGTTGSCLHEHFLGEGTHLTEQLRLPVLLAYWVHRQAIKGAWLEVAPEEMMGGLNSSMSCH